MNDSENDFFMSQSNTLGPPMHIHAMGVISLRYAEFEERVFSLFMHHFDARKIPRDAIELFYFELPERKRLNFLKITFSMHEQDKQVIELVQRVVEYFEWSKEVRNELLHAGSARPFLGANPENIYLAKKESQKRSSLKYMTISLEELRALGIKIQEGFMFCNDLCWYLSLRDTPAEEWTLIMRAASPYTLPKKPDVPSKPKIFVTPHNPLIPPHLRKSSPQ